MREHLEHHGGHPLADFEDDVADEPLADQHVRLALIQTATFDVADVAILEPALREKLVRLAGEVVAFAVFGADVHQADAGILDSQHLMSIQGTHHGILIEVLGPGTGIGADVHQQGTPGQRRQHDGDTGAFDPFEEQPRPQAGPDDRPGVARTDDRFDLFGGHQFPADGDGAIGLFAKGDGRLLVHVDEAVGRLDGEPLAGEPALVAAIPFSRGSSPTRRMCRSSCARTASIAPSTLISGASSPPIASSAIRISRQSSISTIVRP